MSPNVMTHVAEYRRLHQLRNMNLLESGLVAGCLRTILWAIAGSYGTRMILRFVTSVTALRRHRSFVVRRLFAVLLGSSSDSSKPSSLVAPAPSWQSQVTSFSTSFLSESAEHDTSTRKHPKRCRPLIMQDRTLGQPCPRRRNSNKIINHSLPDTNNRSCTFPTYHSNS